MVYFEDILINSKNLMEHLEYLRLGLYSKGAMNICQLEEV